jgi:hypothetical protein
VAVSAEERVVAEAAGEDVVPLEAVDQVVAVISLDVVRIDRAVDVVVVVRSVKDSWPPCDVVLQPASMRGPFGAAYSRFVPQES